MRIILLLIYFILIVVLAVCSLVVMGVATLLSLPFDKERRMVMALSRVVGRSVYLLSPTWRLHIEGAEKMPREGAWVVTCNHQSFFDIPLLFFLPIWKFKFVSKVEVRKIPAIGWMLGMRGDIVIRRGQASAATTLRNEGAAHLNAGTSVVIFPEGTRTKDGAVHRFKEGAFRLAQDNGVGIVPCVLDGTKGLFNARGLQSRHVRLRVLDPISSLEVAATEPKELAARVEERTRKALEELRGAK